MKTDNVKGFRDIEDASKRIAVRKIIGDSFRLYNFKAVETPIIEIKVPNLKKAKQDSNVVRFLKANSFVEIKFHSLRF